MNTKFSKKFFTANFTLASIRELQWNLSKADMLYSGHLSIGDTFSREPMVSTIERFHCSSKYTSKYIEFRYISSNYTLFEVPGLAQL